MRQLQTPGCYQQYKFTPETGQRDSADFHGTTNVALVLQLLLTAKKLLADFRKKYNE